MLAVVGQAKKRRTLRDRGSHVERGVGQAAPVAGRHVAVAKIEPESFILQKLTLTLFLPRDLYPWPAFSTMDRT